VEIPRDGEPFLHVTQIQWSMQELVGLYGFAQQMGAGAVCDMVMDRLHEEIHRPISRTFRSEDGEIQTFSILHFESAFLDYLARTDEQGLNFFTDVLIMMKQAGWEMMAAHGFKGWNARVKKMVERKVKRGDAPSLESKDLDRTCKEFHHHHEKGEECYKAQATLAGPLPTTGTSADMESGTKYGVLDPLACYWERQKQSQVGDKQDKQDKQDTKNVFVRPPKRKRRDRAAGLTALE
jgi:hypothetical protein